ncbi:hypothetical protein [Flavisphingomonas formosensis]|uniref:hypothetical protein n=1 Tax=Flavisphingomonas formosensis TaxID=861534 RepID=UPI0012FBBEB4|nr:hypothetical protein [Sphingomonas formosensis]
MYDSRLAVSGAETADWTGVLDPKTAIADPEPLRAAIGGWRRWIAPAISLAIIAAVALQFGSLDLGRVWLMVPTSPLFWFVFAISYMVGPASEWLIFRRLWRLPAAGLVALLRKLIGNEILLGYIGEVYFYGWARARTDLPGAPFGAIKDVAILSAMTRNAVTLIMLMVSWPLFGSLHLGLEGRLLLLSVATMVASSLVAMLFRRRLFSLPKSDLWFVTKVHLVRIGASAFLSALLWHLVLPSVALSWWLLLSTMRMLISRLPFVPNKDLVFAGVAIFLIGRDAQISDLMAMMGGVILATHLALGALLGTADVAQHVARRIA